jgi:predicted nucleic acid-binding protein
MIDAPSDAPLPLPLFGAGEAAAITVARQLRTVLLINERRAAVYARNIGIPVVTVPSFVVALRAEEVISDRAARRRLAIIASLTTPAFIAEASQLLDALI